MRASIFLPFLLGATYSYAEESQSSDVLDLTAANFDTVVNPEPLILVEFFAPWCGHCKALAPHYEEAATKLKEEVNIKLAKVDCVAEADLCGQHGVSGYPTLKVFRYGEPSDYGGNRKSDGIIAYMVKQSLPAVTHVPYADIEKFKNSDRVVIFAYLPSASHSLMETFTAVAEQYREQYLFGLSTDPEAASDAGISVPAIVLYKKFDEGRNDIPSEELSALTRESLIDFIADNVVPLFDEISGENYASYAGTGLPLAYTFLNPEDEDANSAAIEALKPIAKEHKGKVNFVWIDAQKFGEHAKNLNLKEPKWPAFVIQDISHPQQLKYPLDQGKAVDAKHVGELLAAFTSGKATPAFKSQPVPEAQESGVFVLVGEEFDKVVFDDDKDVFVEFYAPWCGHCKRLAPTWDTLGEKYAAVKDKLTIAKMDATENDVPPSAGFQISSFPTIKFKKAGSRDFIPYEGDRSFESLVEFVEENADALKGSEGVKAATPEPTANKTAHHVDEL